MFYRLFKVANLGSLDFYPPSLIFVGYARLVHPAQSKVANSIINKAIGNVFASDKRKVERRQMEEQLLQENINKSNEESN